ncbi:hypothetical protein CCO03_09365 [Comamonas serinivorans]|uniref:Uncharacterized protein n=1 Tax=Comamonas serinivorans TaxID=1082851 RepID=A0A1Y0EN31_9BURK|nr:circularly permuted type 2 ATP-grasp protein [Comamonas serinivorans]ARU04860.1 hypothetical protein CCO03_09365 [Comamonas serinivorans]
MSLHLAPRPVNHPLPSDPFPPRFDPGDGSPAWQRFWAQARAHGPDAARYLDQRWLDLQRQLQDDEVTYNVYAGDGQLQRQWDVELLPVLIEPQDWQMLERGILQRVRVLNAMLADLYGERKLLRSGLLPPALVQGHPDFLPCMDGVRPPHGTHLHLCAFDLIRTETGAWCLLSQRLQAPSGMGYLLENRHAVLHQLPQEFEALRVRRLAGSYRALVDSLRAHSPAGADSHIALLTPGQYNETYFEHAYLARYLGITLVEGADLTVRDQRLFLKTMHGLSPVHAVIKRMDDQYLDPLELRPDSQLGVPGLMQALRAGNVLMANWPGAGFMESSAILAFLPALARHLLGEDLELPAAPTWWCGEAAVRDQALAMLDDCVIKPTYPAPYPGAAARAHFDPVLTRWLSPAERADWAQRLAVHSDDLTVQAHLPAAHQAVWQWQPDGGRLTDRPVVLRLFALSNGPGQWQVLPGGMARLPVGPHALSSIRLGGTSADVWVVGATASDPQPAASQPGVRMTPTAADLLPRAVTPGLDVARRVRVVTSRAAENLFWLGRYTERVENQARLAQLSLDALHGEEQPSVPFFAWIDLLCRKMGMVPDEAEPLVFTPAEFAQTLVRNLAPGSAHSVGHALQALRAAAAQVRHRMALDHWRAISQAEREFAQAMHSLLQAGSHEGVTRVLTALRERISAIVGAQMDHMTRDDGWRMLTLGRYVERLDFYSQALSQAFYANAVHDFEGYEAVLALFDSTISFHALYQQSQNLASLLDLLVQSRENPRSLGCVTQALADVLATLQRHAPDGAPDLSQLLPAPADAPLALLCAADDVGNFHHLQTLLDACSHAANQVSDQISLRHFTHYHEARHAVWS